MSTSPLPLVRFVTFFSPLPNNLSKETVSCLREAMKKLLLKLLQNPHKLSLVYGVLNPYLSYSITQDHLFQYAIDFGYAHSRLERQLQEQQQCLQEIEAAIASSRALEEEIASHRLQADRLLSALEHFDLNCGYATEKEFNDPDFYANLVKKRQQLIDSREVHERKISGLQKELDTPEKVQLAYQKVEGLRREKDQFFLTMTTIANDLMDLLELTQESDAQALLHHITELLQSLLSCTFL